jgi:hypothetical protein
LGAGSELVLGVGRCSEWNWNWNRKSSRNRNALCRLCAGLLLPRWLRAAVDSRLWRWGSSVQRGVRVLSAGRNTGSGADSVDTVVGSRLRANFLARLGERTEFFRHRERFLSNFVTVTLSLLGSGHFHVDMYLFPICSQ